MSPPTGISYVEIGVSDVQRAVRFYRDALDLSPVESSDTPGTRWLDAGSAAVKLVEAPAGSTLGGWIGDDLQRGMRHVGFKVGDVYRWAERVRGAGAEFTVEPKTAVGEVNLAFFRDPDGTLLEIIDGHLHYHEIFSAGVAERELRAAETRAPDAPPMLDHVAATVADLDTTLAFYQDALGYPPIGKLVHAQDPRGFVIHYLQAGPAVVEIFTFDDETTPTPWSPEHSRLGLRGVGLAVPEVAQTTAALLRAGGQDHGDALVTDPDGVPLRLVGVQ